jgi:hypothetical protein
MDLATAMFLGRSEKRGPSAIRWARRTLLFRQGFYRVPGFFVSHFRGGVSFLGLFESRCRVLVASFVRPLAAVLRGGTMALGCFLVFVSGGCVLFHYVVFFVHEKYSFFRPTDEPGSLGKSAGRGPSYDGG